MLLTRAGTVAYAPCPYHGEQTWGDHLMKCPVCWAEKAYVRRVEGWKGLLYRVLTLVPMKCHHCYHKFVVSWFVMLGKPIYPPKTPQVEAPKRRYSRRSPVRLTPRERHPV